MNITFDRESDLSQSYNVLGLMSKNYILLPRDLCKKNCTNVLLHSISNTYDFAFIYLYTQSTHFDNSKMVKWDHIAQKLTKIQGIM